MTVGVWVDRRTNLMVEADNATKAVEKARPNREEAARLIRYHPSLNASSPLFPISKQCTVIMKETQRRRMTARRW